MMKKFILILSTSLLPIFLFAQEKDTLRNYRDQFDNLSSRDSADIALVLYQTNDLQVSKYFKMPDSTLHEVEINEIHQQIRESIFFDKPRIDSMDYLIRKTHERFYESGELRVKKFYSVSTKDSMMSQLDSVLSYYKNGQVHCHENYRTSTNKCFNSKGKKIRYTKIEKEAQFPNGLDSLNKFLSLNIKYPRAAVDKRMEEYFFADFTICPDGSLCNLTFSNARSEVFMEEARRVILNMPKWEAKEIDGEKVYTEYSLPISFSLIE